MADTKYNITSDNIKLLRDLVEKSVNRKMVTRTDFDFLAEHIRSHVHCSVSATTLKRVYGYINDVGGYTPGRYTVCAMAKLLGYNDFEDFVASAPKEDIQSVEYEGDVIRSSDLPAGTCIEVTWSPGRKCVLKHVADDRWIVKESVNAKLHESQLIACSQFRLHAPLFINYLSDNGTPLKSYIAGARTGIIYRLLDV